MLTGVMAAVLIINSCASGMGGIAAVMHQLWCPFLVAGRVVCRYVLYASLLLYVLAVGFFSGRRHRNLSYAILVLLVFIISFIFGGALLLTPSIDSGCNSNNNVNNSLHDSVNNNLNNNLDNIPDEKQCSHAALDEEISVTSQVTGKIVDIVDKDTYVQLVVENEA